MSRPAPVRGRPRGNLRRLQYDQKTLHDLLVLVVQDYGERLTEEQRDAFEDWLTRPGGLSGKQAEWLVGVAERLGVDPARNLFSSMPEDKRREHAAKVRTRLPWQEPGYQKPLKPPGRG